MAKKTAIVNPDFDDLFDTPEGASEDLGTSPKPIDADGVNSSGVVDDSDVIDYSDETESENELSSDEELVDFYISSREVSVDVVTLSINLKTFEIPVDTEVKVPKYVKEYWQMLGKQKTAFEKKANSMVYDS